MNLSALWDLFIRTNMKFEYYDAVSGWWYFSVTYSDELTKAIGETKRHYRWHQHYPAQVRNNHNGAWVPTLDDGANMVIADMVATMLTELELLRPDDESV